MTKMRSNQITFEKDMIAEKFLKNKYEKKI